MPPQALTVTDLHRYSMRESPFRVTGETAAVVMESLGGYRLVRKLGTGLRADVFLAHPHRDEGGATPVVIKIFHDGVNEGSIMREIEALSRAAGDHVLELRDLTTAPNGVPALILGRCTQGTLGRLVREKSRIGSGEAITVLAPLAMMLARIHDCGVVHGAFTIDSVLFDAAGSPTLCRFGTAQLISPGLPPAGRERESGVQSDLAAMLAMTRTVLERVHDEAVLSTMNWLADTQPGEPGWLHTLSDRLFDLGEPREIDFGVPAVAVTTAAVPVRMVPTAAVVDIPENNSGIFSALNLPDGLLRILPTEARVRTTAKKLALALRAVRLRFWLAAGLIVAGVVCALALIPQKQSEATVTAPEQPKIVASATADAVDNDDPIAAVVELLAARERCMRDLSILCLDHVDQKDSAAMRTDRLEIRELQEGAGLPASWAVDPAQVSTQERLGNSAIVSLGQPTDNKPSSLLIIKDETGWKIRDYLE
ncbi:MAG: protein kinase domain-containing protein [Rhodoglobus sp.]